MRRPLRFESALAVGSLGLLSFTLLAARPAPGPSPAPRALATDEWELERPAPVLADGEPARLDRVEELSCNECHAAIVEEWSETQHALAWVDAGYQEEMLDHRRPESCHGCHAPVPVHDEALGGRPDARPEGVEGVEDRHFGISCESCHLAPDGAMLGPRGLSGGDAHASRMSETMTGAGSNQLCITCHATNIGPVIGIAKDFVDSKQAARGRTCVECHLAEVEREDGTKTRSHLLQTPRDPDFLRRAFEVAVAPRGSKTVVTITNATGHRIPGLIGRDLVFEASVVDAQGAELGRVERKLNTRTFLPVDSAFELELPSGAEVVLSAVHHDPRLERDVPFLEERLPVPGR